jgi:hypothetical protein
MSGDRVPEIGTKPHQSYVVYGRLHSFGSGVAGPEPDASYVAKEVARGGVGETRKAIVPSRAAEESDSAGVGSGDFWRLFRESGVGCGEEHRAERHGDEREQSGSAQSA